MRLVRREDVEEKEVQQTQYTCAKSRASATRKLEVHFRLTARARSARQRFIVRRYSYLSDYLFTNISDSVDTHKLDDVRRLNFALFVITLIRIERNRHTHNFPSGARVCR